MKTKISSLFYTQMVPLQSDSHERVSAGDTSGTIRVERTKTNDRFSSITRFDMQTRFKLLREKER